MTGPKAENKRVELLRIYRLWQTQNILRHAYFSTITCSYVMLIMIYFDYLFVADPEMFIATRVISLFLCVPLLWLCHMVQKIDLGAKKARLVLSTLLLAPTTIFQIAYYYFVFIHQHEKINIYFAGMLLGVFFTTFVLHKFWREQHLFNGFFALATIPFSVIFPAKADFAYVIIVVHLTAAFIFTFFRRDFVGNLFVTYNLLKMMVPAKIAEVLVVANESTNAPAAFSPKGRFTVCLCSDWRNFQKLAAKKTADEVSKMLEEYYDLVLSKLEELLPSNNYYFSWTADELFIVFFNDANERQEVLRDALIFSKVLATEVYAEISKKHGGEILFDLGLSSGIGLLGLQGPKNFKKTTISGEVAGCAKRYQDEAKLIRQSLLGHAAPLVVIDETIYFFNKVLPSFDEQNFERRVATTKDIQGQTCYVWTMTKTTEKDLNDIIEESAA